MKIQEKKKNKNPHTHTHTELNGKYLVWKESFEKKKQINSSYQYIILCEKWILVSNTKRKFKPIHWKVYGSLLCGLNVWNQNHIDKAYTFSKTDLFIAWNKSLSTSYSNFFFSWSKLRRGIHKAEQRKIYTSSGDIRWIHYCTNYYLNYPELFIIFSLQRKHLGILIKILYKRTEKN